MVCLRGEGPHNRRDSVPCFPLRFSLLSNNNPLLCRSGKISAKFPVVFPVGREFAPAETGSRVTARATISLDFLPPIA
jgi:hypothetical protein